MFLVDVHLCLGETPFVPYIMDPTTFRKHVFGPTNLRAVIPFSSSGLFAKDAAGLKNSNCDTAASLCRELVVESAQTLLKEADETGDIESFIARLGFSLWLGFPSKSTKRRCSVFFADHRLTFLTV